METLLLYASLGTVAGLLAGLLGVGGGLVIVPVLAWVFVDAGFSTSVIMHLALGTSLATIVVTSISSAYSHHKYNAVLWPLAVKLAPGIVIGAWLGATVADQLPSTILQKVFGVFEILVAVQMALNVQAAAHRTLPGKIMTSVAGTVIGGVSAIVGIGGGTLTVPFLHWCNVNMRNAVATSAACGFPIAVAGVLGYIVAGWSNTMLPAGSSGYVYWPAFAAISITSLMFAPLGAKLAHTIPVPLLKRIFSVVLLVLGIKMLM
jgi:hypothetical protein